MRRAALTMTLAFGILHAPFAVDAQPSGKMARIGVLCAVTCENPAIAAFRQALRAMGYVEGRNVAFEWRPAEGKLERLPALVAELVGQRVDVIVTGGTPAALAAKNATRTIPIVMGTAGDPVRSGLVASLARPGGNVTGFSILAFELSIKRLELLKQAVPRASRVGYLRVPGIQPGPVAESASKERDTAARSLGVQIQDLNVRGPADFSSAFSTMVRERTDAFVVQNVAPLNAHVAQLVDLAIKHRLPGMAEPREFAEAGGLLAYGVNTVDLYRRPPCMWTGSSRGPSRPTCQWSNPRGSSWSSTSRPRRPSASRSPNPSSSARTT